MCAEPSIDFDEQMPRMYRVALRILGDSESADEVVQEVCVKALRKRASFDGRSAVATWLYRITVNCAMDQMRARKRWDRGGADINGELGGLLACTQPTPAASAELRELHRIAKAMVEALPEESREAFVLTQLDGFSYDEAAAITQQPRGSIASRVHRAKRILMEQLNQASKRRSGS